MQIIDPECKACAAFENCSTACGKGSMMCAANRLQSHQTKAEMARAIERQERPPYREGDPREW